MSKVPVTIVTGFLGTGKTTLIKRVCSECSSRRIGVIQNEYSELMGIESPILIRAGATVFQLPNGCYCCSVRSDLVSALEAFLELGDRIDWIIVETAGTTDPVSFAGSLWLDDGLESRLKFDGVVTLTDAATLDLFLRPAPRPSDPPSEHRDFSELGVTFSKQLSVADLIVLNRADLSPPTDAHRAFIASLNSCRLVESVRCDFDLELMFGLDTLAPVKLKQAQLPAVSHHYPARLKSVSFSTSGVYSLKRFNDSVASLLWEARSVYRCKGLFRAVSDCAVVGHTDGAVRAFHLQGIGDVFQIDAVDCDVPENTLLFIGNELDREALLNMFALWCNWPA